MPENAGYNPDNDAKAKAALEQAESLVAQEEAERAKAQETGDQKLDLDDSDLDGLLEGFGDDKGEDE
ncbi:MAG: hypothetical protein A2534_02705 [Candidatus Magasanikbacteria bacterium RIFOXYD2_FULL_39_9]|uniref:Uncharacterized protein n=1 Tax=Candidatus Magasanikbacteria bacterium RIFOXYD1_FULL_40_23 TaxID=1798705 RepID=A0A1F6P7R9_9BACT|nr:MAG: hypothetical protein A2563_00680 [Candidatus Magasanikbacteria bacterium RIFOXYD1_FULL_40_23]OGH92164.1 MAG: hypothetical protein A2534_02705 [Candidatus Magasanikbacteria bacterium RIFOXYD2_FULL_39_9]